MPNAENSTATYFVTSATFERCRLFQVARHAEIVIEALQHYRSVGHYKLHAFVVMPDHMHLLLTPQGITIERAVGLIKGGSSHRLDSRFPVWQKGFHERRMRDAQEFLARKEYVHLNPVRARLVTRPEEYPYSSAYRRGPAAAEAALP